MGKRIAFSIIFTASFSFMIFSNIIFQYNECLQPLDKAFFYGSVVSIQETRHSYRLYISINPHDLFTVYIQKDILDIESFEAFYHNPVAFRTRLWNQYYEVYSSEDIRFPEL